MRLRSLELQGFKSFPDRMTIKFGDGITAVVGPNGSGKSNISDAVRWVLGEQSNKSLRGASREDVIFNGTSTRKAQGFAEVTLTIDNTSRRLPFEGDTVAVTRRYYRSGSSEYMINKAAVRLVDVRNLFLDTGLGRDGYSMIGQGKISSVVECRPEERREMFEEAAGIAKFRNRKKDAERDLERADEQLVRVLDILSGLEERVEPLHEQSEKAKRFLELAAQKKELEIGLWLRTIENSGQTLREQEQKIQIANRQQAEVEEALEQAAREIEESYAEMSRLAAQMDEVRRAAAQSEGEAAGKENEITVLENDIRHGEENIVRIQGDMEQSESSRQRLLDEISQREKTVAEDRAYIEEKRCGLDACTGQLENLTAGMSDSSSRLETVNREMTEIARAISEARVAGVTAQSSISEITARQDTVAQTLCDQRARASELNTELGETKAMFADTEQRCESLKNTVDGFELRLKKRREKLEAQRKVTDELRLDAEEKLRRARLLEELERNMEGFNASVKVVMKEHSRGTLSGIHGAVSRLIRVPERYSTATETALGAALQNIVVSTEEDAKRAIQMLKQRQAGRATFLPLSSVRGTVLQEKGLEQCPGFIGIASTLVQCDGRYDTILRSLLGRVAVAEDMDAAVRIGRQYSYRFRVVTLDGQVVNAGGSLTGGSLVKNAGILNRANEIERIHKLAEELKYKAEEAKEQLQRAEEEASAAEAALLGARGEWTSAQEERIKIEAECRRLGESLDAAKRTVSSLEEEAAQAVLRLKALEEAKTRADAQEEALAQTLSEREQSLQELTGDKETLLQRREIITAQMNSIRMEMLSAEKDIENHRTAMNDLRQRMETSESRRNERESQIEAIRAQNQALEGSIVRLRAEAQTLMESAARAAQEIEALSQKRLALEAQSTKRREAERQKAHERDVVGRELTRLQEQKVGIQKEYDEIIARLWDEYELTRSEAQTMSTPIEEPQKAARLLSEIKGKIKVLGSVNVGAIEEYKEVYEQYTTLGAQVEDIQTSRDQIRKHIGELTVQMREIFLERFTFIGRNFSDIFKELFGGGEASLKLTDPDDVLETGIEIKAQPPEKNVGLLSLSGGEKTMIALSLYFAIMRVNPPPFCILDEVEAALDDVNVERYGNYLRKMCRNTQFIAITHRRGTMEEADMLYGVTMQEKGITKMLELNVAEIEQQMNLS